MVSSFCSRPSRLDAVLLDVRAVFLYRADGDLHRSRWYTQEMSITSRLMVAENRPRFFGGAFCPRCGSRPG